MIPLISSISCGPLGVCQLPRFWSKVLLRKANLLDPEYPDCSGGLDQSVLDVLGLDKEATLAYLRDYTPTYTDFEAWVLRQKGGAFDPALREAVEKWNAAVRDRRHTRPEKLEETTRDIGIPNDGAITSAVLLNSLQDWQLFYRRDLNGNLSAFGGRVVPLISTVDYGPLGACQLPRTWLKITLKARGVLHPDYPECGGGLDARILDALGVDRDAVVAHIHQNRPTYLEFEAWVRQQKGGAIDKQKVEACNRAMLERTHNEKKRAEIHATVGLPDDGSITSGVVLNHIEDWQLAYNELAAGLNR